MVEANVKIIEELQTFLKIVSGENDIRELFTMDPSDFKRTRKLPLERIAQLVINFPKRSLSIEVSEFFEKLVTGNEYCTKSAFTFRQKNQQQIEVFSGHRAITILQDYYAAIFAGNLQSLLKSSVKPISH